MALRPGRLLVVLLGVLATRSGLIFTGQPEVLFGQSASVAVVVVYSTAMSLLLAFGVRLLDIRGERAREQRRRSRAG